jgi:outer membrane lipoprotein
MEGVNQTLRPAQTVDNKTHVNKKAVWGGMIVEVRNFTDNSQIEMLNYPLDNNAEPVRTAQAQGRFIIKVEGFLDPAQYSSGRWLSVLGTIRPSEAGQIGDVKYQYPVIQSQQLHLWSDYSSSGDSSTRFHFGIGIGIGR